MKIVCVAAWVPQHVRLWHERQADTTSHTRDPSFPQVLLLRCACRCTSARDAQDAMLHAAARYVKVNASFIFYYSVIMNERVMNNVIAANGRVAEML